MEGDKLRPEQVKERSKLELKLGIKSSLPNVKSALALLYTLWIANDRKTDIVFGDENGNKLLLKNDIFNRISIYYDDILLDKGITKDELSNRLNKNVILTSQIESLKVAFELIWRLAIVKFNDETKPFSAERQGGNRYSKKLQFTKNIDMVDLLIQSNEKEYKKVLLNWLISRDTSYNENIERQLIKVFTIISEESVYRLRVDENNDIKFINAGIYEKFEDGTEKIDVSDYKENMGSLRVLQNLLKENLNYFLSKDGKNISIKDILYLSELKEYTKRVNHFLDLTNINVEIVINKEIEEEVIEEDEIEIKDIIATNTIFYGAPGTGKSYDLDEKSKKFDFLERVTFYPEYSHDDFIGCFMPCMSYIKNDTTEYISIDGTSSDLPGKPIPYYTFVPGPFTNALVNALNNTDKNVLLIVEELNRANAAAVFGEVFQLLDRTHTGESKYSISVSNEYSEYLASKISTYSKGEKVKIPNNLTICATMNSADQGVNPLDSAFKRRWNFKYVPIDFTEATHRHYQVDYAKKKVTWEVFAITINKKLKEKYINEDKHLGQYFITETEIRDSYKFASKILLYLFDDVLKFNRKGFFKDYKTFSDLLTDFNGGKEVFDFSFEYVVQATHSIATDNELALDTEVSDTVSEKSEAIYNENIEDQEVSRVAEDSSNGF